METAKAMFTNIPIGLRASDMKTAAKYAWEAATIKAGEEFMKTVKDAAWRYL